MSSREEVLARIRTALRGDDQGAAGEEVAGHDVAGQGAAGQGAAGQGAAGQGAAEPGAGAQAGEPGRAYRTRGELGSGPLLDLLAERLIDYRAAVRRATPGELGAVIGAALTQRGVRRVVAPPGLELPELPAGVEAVADDNLDARALDALDGVITAATVAIAETGTIVLDSSPDQGRRAITLVPDYHLCIVRAAQVVALVPEAIARLSGHPERPLTWISGPSATSDIELERVEGVHGPRALEVILVGPA
jgi:L-lactate dehydrogenase complex protein LldG